MRNACSDKEPEMFTGSLDVNEDRRFSS